MNNQTQLQRAADLLAQSAGPFDEACAIIRAMIAPWYEVRMAFAAGQSVEQRTANSDGQWSQWRETKNPQWHNSGYHEYRVSTAPAEAPGPSLLPESTVTLTDWRKTIDIPSNGWLPCPDWVMWQATDKNGETWGFEHEPKAGTKEWFAAFRRTRLATVTPPADFRTTLVERPSVPATGQPTPAPADDEAVRAQEDREWATAWYEDNRESRLYQSMRQVAIGLALAAIARERARGETR